MRRSVLALLCLPALLAAALTPAAAVALAGPGGATPATRFLTGQWQRMGARAFLTPLAAPAPVSTVAPTLTGVAQRGHSLAVNAGTWSPAGQSYAFQWQRDTGSGFTSIAGATTTSYTPGSSDLGASLRVAVAATNTFGTATANSNATGPVAPDPPVNAGSPWLGGTAKRTFTLTASPGSWSPAGATFAFQWQRDTGAGFTDIGGATGAQYTLATADVGYPVRVRITATNVDGATAVMSAPTPAVAPASPGSTLAPRLSGTSHLHDAVTVTTGTWNPAAVSYAYQWERFAAGAYTDIAGETSATYILVAADVGTTVRARVTATNPDGSASATSLPTPTVAAPPVAPAGVAAPTGTLTDTGVLTADPGTWTPVTTTFTYQWLRCLSGATAVNASCVPVGLGSTYRLAAEDVGHAMAVRVTGRASNLTTAVNSLLTSDVRGRALAAVAVPTIQGTVQVAEAVRAGSATWSVPTRSVKHQWQRCDADGSNCADIAGAGAQAYVVTVADGGHALVVRETAVSPGRTASAVSAVAVVADQPAPLVISGPAIIGTAARTANLQATPGSWDNKPTRFAYAWQRCNAAGTSCAAIMGANSNSYRLGPADVGATVSVAVTATNTAGNSMASAPVTAVVAAVRPVVRVVPSISGKLQVPQMLQAVGSQFQTTLDTRYGYRWQRCNASGASCVDIPGALGQSYRLATADARGTVRVIHTATNPDGAVGATSAPTAVIKPAAPALLTQPWLSLSGLASVGKTVSIRPGIWSAATEITGKVLQFWRCHPACVALSTGGAGSYTLGVGDAGALIRGSETATGPGGTLVAWAPTWAGPVRSPSTAFAMASTGAMTTMRTSTGVALATATVAAAKASAIASAAADGSAARTGTVRIAVRRAAKAGGTLRAWACVARPAATDTRPCTKAVRLGRGARTVTLAVVKGDRARVVVVRARHR